MNNPFAGLQQGMQAAGGLIDMYNAPRDRAYAMEQARQKMALQQAQLAQGQTQLDQAQQRIDLQERAKDEETRIYMIETLSALAGIPLKHLKEGNQESAEKAFSAIEAITGKPIPPEMRTLEAVEGIYNARIGKKKTIVESAQFKDDAGNTYSSATMSDGSKVVTPLTPGAPEKPVGELSQVSKSTGLTAKERVTLATEQALSTSEASALGKRRDEIKASYTEGRNKATGSLTKIRDLEKIVSSFGEGGLSKAGRIAAAKIPLLRDASQEEFLSLSNQVILSQKDELLGGGILSDSDIMLLQSTGTQLGNTKEGNIRILNQMEKAANAAIENEKLFRQHLNNGGTPEGFVIPDRLDPDSFTDQPTEGRMTASEPVKTKDGSKTKVTSSKGLSFEVIDK